ncbi:MAG: tRNA (guanosine(37)-N1)-methyltransferase TrmD [Candidatus Pacebacteria bacterium]|nr:tRNA (guanosine(37)-N1)-methyltransferase TrmD [Candidatus Paceibacterota bacterium]
MSKKGPLNFHIVTLFPESIEPYLATSILGRARGITGKKKGAAPLITVSYYNPRDYSTDKWKRVDQRPYGGGPGMVLEPESMLKAAVKAGGFKKGTEVIFFSPSGKQFDAAEARRLAKKKDIVFISGRYEGVDARVPKILKATAMSVGPYVLTGGELPAAIMIDAIARQVPGVLGDINSLEERRKSTYKAKGEQEDATASSEVYTKPETFVWKKKKYPVPKVLLSGNHKAIEEWKKSKTP